MRKKHLYKTPEEQANIRQAGKLAAQALAMLAQNVRPGISTADLDRLAEVWVRDHGAIPTFLGYMDFPASICVAVNQEVVHGIPSPSKILQEGDIISIDIGITHIVDNISYIGDNATTVAVGEISPRLQALLTDTRYAMEQGIAQCKIGNKISDIAKAIEKVAIEKGYGSVEEFGGHGVGPEYHCEPFIPNYTGFFRDYPDHTIEEGMVLAVEPMFALGLKHIRKAKDNWTILTKDNKPCAHFEYSALVLPNGPEIITLP